MKKNNDLLNRINHIKEKYYNSVIARFLGPDPVLQNPYSTQNYNRYSYVMNNPLKYTDPTGYRMSFQELSYFENQRVQSGGGDYRGYMFGANIDWINPNGAMESAYFGWANLYYNGVTNTSFEDFVNSNGNYKLNGSGVEHFSGNGALADAKFYLKTGIKASVGVGEAQPDYGDWTNYNSSGYANEYFASNEGDNRINLGTDPNAYSTVVDFLRDLSKDPDKRGLVGDYFVPSAGKYGKSNGKYGTIVYPVTVRGQKIDITLQFNKESHLTGRVSQKNMKGLHGWEFEIRAYGQMELYNDSYAPMLITIHYPSYDAYDLYKSTWDYIYGRTDTW
ncbi:MAG: RHS repeat-associated core domain-containing protein [Salinivirgaceae bacterium]